MSVFETHQGTSPVILAFPHTGTHVPSDIWEKLNDNGQLLADTDWHIHHLYADLLPKATTVRATFHRYVIDANRDPEGVSLYPGQNTTELVPKTDFDSYPIWKNGQEPDADEISQRRTDFHAPYHAALAAEIERVKALHGIAVLYDCHSIRSVIPYLFEGRLPDFNIGTNSGLSCDPRIMHATTSVVAQAKEFSFVVNGRFKGGWTTRHYGKPKNKVHAIQMELSQISHLASEAPPFDYDQRKAKALRTHLKSILTKIEDVALQIARG